MPETQAEYEARCLTWGDGTYRPAYNAHVAMGSGTPPWKAPPATGASGADWAAWLDDAGGYREWFPPNSSGGNSPPPPPPTKKKN
jgi:hypothetical protein